MSKNPCESKHTDEYGNEWECRESSYVPHALGAHVAAWSQTADETWQPAIRWPLTAFEVATELHEHGASVAAKNFPDLVTAIQQESTPPAPVITALVKYDEENEGE